MQLAKWGLKICISARDLGALHTAGGLVRGLQAIWGWRVSPQSRRIKIGVSTLEPEASGRHTRVLSVGAS